MFDFSLGEMLVIIIIAILFLGPDKLPKAMVDIAKFLRQVKRAIGSVQDSLEKEMNAGEISHIKEEALAYKRELLQASDDLKRTTDMTALGDHLTNLHDEVIGDVQKPQAPQPAPVAEKITFEKKPKQDSADV